MLASERGQIPSGIVRKGNGKKKRFADNRIAFERERAIMLAHAMLKSPAKVLPFFHIKTYLSLPIILVPLTTAYETLLLKIDIPITTKMQAPRLLGVQFKAQDSDHHGHRTNTSVLSLLTRPRTLLTDIAASRREHTSRLSKIESR